LPSFACKSELCELRAYRDSYEFTGGHGDDYDCYCVLGRDSLNALMMEAAGSTETPEI